MVFRAADAVREREPAARRLDRRNAAAGTCRGIAAGCLLCSLALRKSYGLPLVRWYAGLRVLVHGVAVIAPLVAGYDPEVSGGYAGLVRTEVLNLVRGGLWFGFLCWLERSQTLARLMPAAKRRALWWAVVPMAALALFGM